jgi:ubiquinone/menaquinone biosynthesis C-methylase UbiE
VGPRGTVVGLDLNEGMLRQARAAASRTATGVEFTAASASEMPFEDGAFDVVFCQQALQYFQDRPRAIQEMRRVLARKGRLAISVWRPIEHNPGYVVLADALERHVGPEASAVMRSPFPSWSLEDLREIFRNAGFTEVHINLGIGTIRYPSAHEFLRREVASSPLAGPLEHLSASVRDAVVRDVEAGLRSYQDDDGLVFPMETYLVLALP